MMIWDLQKQDADMEADRGSGSWIWYGKLMDMELINDEDKLCHVLSSGSSSKTWARGQRQSFWKPDTIIMEVLLRKHMMRWDCEHRCTDLELGHHLFKASLKHAEIDAELIHVIICCVM